MTSVSGHAHDPDLVRYWFKFDVSALGPPPPAPGTVTLDGGTNAYRLCWRGLGVTGYDRADCLRLVAQLLEPELLPPIESEIRNVDVARLDLDDRLVGVPVWRGVWFPSHNRGGPAR